MTSSRKRLYYVLADLITAGLSYSFLFGYRKLVIEPSVFGYAVPLTLNQSYLLGLLFIPLFWIAIYYFSGYYKEVMRKSRLQELGQTFLSSLIGIGIIFFLIIIDDTILDYRTYYQTLTAFWAVHFGIAWISRFVLTSLTVHQIQTGKLSFNTLLVGGNAPALEVYEDMTRQPEATGYRIIGFVGVNDKNGDALMGKLPKLGPYTDIVEIIQNHKVEEVIIAIDPGEQEMISKIINLLHIVNVRIRAIPSLNDLLSGKVKYTALFDTPLLEISHDPIPGWQMNVKQFVDIAGSLVFLLVTSPLCITLAILIKISSRGPVFYSHERIGRFGKPFRIYKFRSMYIDSEKNGPELSSRNDPRITPVGRFMRKTRLDEIPNFFNVLKGDMSLVGPRPERRYFINQIIQRAPHYVHLHRVKPGITSWGQVKYGYAENVDQMIKRLRYDILYIENMSLGLDFKILLYTVLIILKGRGV